MSVGKHKGPLFTTTQKSGPSDPFQIPLPFWPFSAAPQQHQRQPHHLSKLVEQVKKKIISYCARKLSYRLKSGHSDQHQRLPPMDREIYDLRNVFSLVMECPFPLA